jgi:hypothetical protein
MGLFVYRLFGAAMLDASTYEGIEADRSGGTWQAVATVVLSSLAAGVGAGGWYGSRLTTFAIVSAVALVMWVAWATLVFQIGTKILPAPETDSDLGELLRTIGFAAAPGLLQVFGALPRMAGPVFVGTSIWMFAAMVVAVRHALDYSGIGRALAVCGLAAGLSIGLAFLLGLFFGPAAS